MNMPKEIKAMPWPENYDGIKGADYKVTGQYKAADHERLLVLTFMLNRAHLKKEHYSYDPSMRDFRVVISKKQRDFCVQRRNENKTGRRKLRYVFPIFGACSYADVDQRTEAMYQWMMPKNTDSWNHGMARLENWCDRVIDEQRERVQVAKGKIPDDAIKTCPEDLPEGLWDWAYRNCVLTDHVMLYKKGGVRGYCCHCRERVRADPGHHFRQDQATVCPNCGESMIAILQDGAAWKADYVDNVMMAEKGGDGTVWFRLWHIFRDDDGAYIGGGEKWLKEIARYCVRGDHAAMWLTVYKQQSMARCWEYDLDGWTRCREIYVYDGQYTFCDVGLAEAVAGTRLQYAMLPQYLDDPFFEERWNGRNILLYAINFARYPVIEFLYKAGYKKIVDQKVHYGISKNNRNAILWQRKKLQECFRFPLRLLKIMPPEQWDMDALERVRRIWGMPGITEKNLILFVGNKDLPTEKIMTLLRSGRPEKTVRYLQKQTEEHPGETMRSVVSMYFDYMEEIKKLGLNARDESIAFPKDLIAQHRRTSEMIDQQQNKALYEKFAKAVKKLLPLSWESGDYLIRPAMSPAELRDEGAALHHCVGGYAERVADGKAAIFFVRKKDKPGESFFTLELSNKSVYQCRTLNNRSYTTEPEIEAFVQQWVKEVVQKPQRSGKKKAASAAA